jgi:6-phosphogluconate dehydrogenase
MEIGMIGLGRMGSGMVRRLLQTGHQCIVYDLNPKSVAATVEHGAVAASSLAELVKRLDPPRAVWLMLPAGVVDATVSPLSDLLARGDALIDGGNSYYRDDRRRAAALAPKGIDYLDVGTSGGVWGLERGFCLMIGGEPRAVARLDPIFAALAPGFAAAPRTPGRRGEPNSAERGYLHCGPSGAGHFVKMIHNGIEYGLMAAYAEGLSILRHADVGLNPAAASAEATPLRDPADYSYRFDLAQIAELWRRGSVIPSWLLDLTAEQLARSPDLAEFAGQVADSGEGRWTIVAAIDEAVPAPALTAALYERFASRGAGTFAGKVMSAMRHSFGGHAEDPVAGV